MKLPVHIFPDALLRALGLPNRGAGYAPMLSESVHPVVIVADASGQSGSSSSSSTDADTAANCAFAGYGSQANVAAQNSYMQIMNPALSGKVVYVDRVEAEFDATIRGLVASLYDTELTTDVGAVVNKYSGQSAGAAHLRSKTDALALGVTIAQTKAPASMSCSIAFDPPIRLDAGKGLAVRCDAANVPITTSWQLREYVAA